MGNTWNLIVYRAISIQYSLQEHVWVLLLEVIVHQTMLMDTPVKMLMSLVQFRMQLLLLRCGDVESNPDPASLLMYMYQC